MGVAFPLCPTVGVTMTIFVTLSIWATTPPSGLQQGTVIIALGTGICLLINQLLAATIAIDDMDSQLGY